MLVNSEEGKAIALTYFKERGFTNETIKKFSLGYSPTTWDALTKEALGKGYKLEFLEKTGLTIGRGNLRVDVACLAGLVTGIRGRVRPASSAPWDA